MSITRKLDEWFYPNATRVWDDVRFVELVRQNLRPDFRILDFGAGRGKTDILDFRKSVQHVTGADVDEGVLENPLLHRKLLIEPGQPLDIESDSLDLVYSCNVMEHLAEPSGVFSEIRRILKPGGLYLGKTTNRNHYIAVAARSTPLWFHKYYNRLRGRQTIDTFPTTYRCNSRRQLATAVDRSGLEIENVDFWEGRPEYLRISPVSYVAGIAYEKLVNSSAIWSRFRAVMVVNLRKPARVRENRKTLPRGPHRRKKSASKITPAA